MSTSNSLKEALLDEFLPKAEVVTEELFSSFSARSQKTLDLPDLSEIRSLTSAASLLLQLQSEIDELEKSLSEAKKTAHELRTRILPSLMNEAGTVSIDTGSYSLRLQPFVSVSLPEDAEPAYAWLESIGHGACIKNTVSLDFDTTDAERAREAMSLLGDYQDVLSVRKRVHPSTLKSLLRRLVEEGETVPLELFGAYVGQTVSITQRREKS